MRSVADVKTMERIETAMTDQERTMADRAAFSTDAERWQAVTRRAPEADGAFVYSVTTTGIYCRPACPSRRPRRENVRFFDTWQEAEQAGFRPCKRCAPQTPGRADRAAEAVVRACQIIEAAEQPPSLQELADAVGLSRYHFHRLFRKRVGVTPRQYADQVRVERVRARLQPESTVTEALYEAGFESSSRFYEAAPASLGMPPKAYRDGGQGIAIRFAIAQSYLGWVLVAATDRGICRIDLGDSPEVLHRRLQARFPQAELDAHDPRFRETVARVLAFLQEPGQGWALPLDVQGTAFQRRVWDALRQIPAGVRVSYGDVAARIGSPRAARAVARACATNEVAVAIPCHRVVRSDGELGGYRWGIERKRAILARESAGD